MDAHFYLSVLLIVFVFFLCYWFRKGKKEN
jgi:cbb3-type cytochrome oxidase subunit 3